MRRLSRRSLLGEDYTPSAAFLETPGFKDYAQKVENILRPLYGKMSDDLENFMMHRAPYVMPAGFIETITTMVRLVVTNEGLGDTPPGPGEDRWTSPVFAVAYAAVVFGERYDFLKKMQKLTDEMLKAYDEWEHVKPDAAEGAKDLPFGKYVFAPARGNTVPREKNTKIEDSVYHDMVFHVSDNSTMSDDTMLALSTALADNTYPEILHEPSAEYVFRGMTLREESLTDLIGESPSKDGCHFKDVSKRVGSRKSSQPGNPKIGQGSMSWTTWWPVAQSFSSPMSNAYSVILVARVKDNPDTFLEGPNGFYKARTLASFEDTEKETIALGSVRLCRVYWQWCGVDGSGGKISVEFDPHAKNEGRGEDLLRDLIREEVASSGYDRLVDTPEFVDFVEDIDDAIRPLYGRVEYNDIAALLQDELVETPAEQFAGKIGLVAKVAIDSGGFGTTRYKIREESWSDPIYAVARLYNLTRNGQERAAIVSELSAGVKKIKTHIEKLNDVPRESTAPPEESPFGDYVFAPQRRNQVPYEKNTREEDNVYWALKHHVVDNVPFDTETALTLMDVLDNNTYPSVLHSPDSDFVFRGLRLDPAVLERLLGRDCEIGDGLQRFERVSKKVGSRLQGGQSTSWTTDWTVAKRWSEASFTSGKISVVLVARVKDNPDTFLEGPGGFYSVDALAEYMEDEQESIALGDVKICGVYWRHPRHDEYFSTVEGNFDPAVLNATTNEGLRRETESTADPEDSPFGDFVFAPDRDGDVPYEKNTPVEDKVYDALKNHVGYNKPLDDEAAIELMKVLDDGTYPNVIHQPSDEYVFRGLHLNEKDLTSLLGFTPSKDGQHSKIVSAKIGSRHKQGNSSAWTSSWGVACNYSFTAGGDGLFSVVLVARVSENPDTFLAGRDGFYKARHLSIYAHEEDEVVALGAVKTCKVYWKWPGDETRGLSRIMGEFDMKEDTNEGLLRGLVREVLMNEVDMTDVDDVCYTAGSTHVMKTCKIGGDKYFLKFSDEELFEGFDPSLQILIEYLAYRIYGLFSGIFIPTPELVYDTAKKRVGIATTPASGVMALSVGTDPKLLAKMMSQGVYVDVFLANWDVIGTGSGNVFVDKGRATRIDPGASLTFRAQGGRKGKAFGPKAGELETMLKAGQGAGEVFRYADLKAAAKEFLAVPWKSIRDEIDLVEDEVSEQLRDRKMTGLLKQWTADVKYIRDVLAERHAEVSAHAQRFVK